MVTIRVRIAAVLVLLVMATVGLAAQNTAADDDGTSRYYVRSIVITQIAIGDYGYRVSYLNGRGRLHNAYIPHEWFSAAAGKGELIETWSRSAPFMEVYYQDGGFSHVRMYVIPTYDHISWTVLGDDEDVEGNFGAEELVINYN